MHPLLAPLVPVSLGLHRKPGSPAGDHTAGGLDAQTAGVKDLPEELEFKLQLQCLHSA